MTSVALVRVILALAPAFAITPSPPPASAWRVTKQEEGVAARIAPSGGRVPWGGAEGIIDAPPAAVLAHLLDFEHMVGTVPGMGEVRVLRRGEGEALVYLFLDLPWPIANRDYTARYRWVHTDDGHERLYIQDDNPSGPPPGDAIRMTTVRGVWDLAPAPGGRTLARYELLADLGGSLTSGMIEQTAWKQPLRTILGIRKILASRR